MPVASNSHFLTKSLRKSNNPMTTWGQSNLFNSIQSTLSVSSGAIRRKNTLKHIINLWCFSLSFNITVCTHISPVALSQIVREVMLYLADELLGVLRVESEDLAEALEADVLQVAVSQGLDVGVGLDHLFLRQGVRANQISFTWGGAPICVRGVGQTQRNAERCKDR